MLIFLHLAPYIGKTQQSSILWNQDHLIWKTMNQLWLETITALLKYSSISIFNLVILLEENNLDTGSIEDLIK